MTVKLLIEQHFEFLSLKGGSIGLSESTLVKIPHCWNSRHGSFYSGERWKLYEVRIEVDEAYHISCWKHILSIIDEEFVVMAIDSEHEKEVLNKIHDIGKFELHCEPLRSAVAQ